MGAITLAIAVVMGADVAGTTFVSITAPSAEVEVDAGMETMLDAIVIDDATMTGIGGTAAVDDIAPEATMMGMGGTTAADIAIAGIAIVGTIALAGISGAGSALVVRADSAADVMRSGGGSGVLSKDGVCIVVASTRFSAPLDLTCADTVLLMLGRVPDGSSTFRPFGVAMKQLGGTIYDIPFHLRFTALLRFSLLVSDGGKVTS